VQLGNEEVLHEDEDEDEDEDEHEHEDEHEDEGFDIPVFALNYRLRKGAWLPRSFTLSTP